MDGDPLAGLNRHLRKAKLDAVLDRLRGARLLAKESTHDDTLDTHPIVREHFGERLKTRHPKSWQDGDRKSTRLNSSHNPASRMPSSA
jgi:hypothetical protein